MTDYTLNRRRFLSLGGGAALAAGLAACTGSSDSATTTGSGTGSTELRLFTYEDNSTIELLKAQVKQFDTQNGTTTTVDSLPGSSSATTAPDWPPASSSPWCRSSSPTPSFSAGSSVA